MTDEANEQAANEEIIEDLAPSGEALADVAGGRLFDKASPSLDLRVEPTPPKPLDAPIPKHAL